MLFYGAELFLSGSAPNEKLAKAKLRSVLSSLQEIKDKKCPIGLNEHLVAIR